MDLRADIVSRRLFSPSKGGWTEPGPGGAVPLFGEWAPEADTSPKAGRQVGTVVPEAFRPPEHFEKTPTEPFRPDQGTRRAGIAAATRLGRPEWRRRQHMARAGSPPVRPAPAASSPYWVKVPLSALDFEHIAPPPRGATAPAPRERKRRWPARAALAASLALTGLALIAGVEIAHRLPGPAPAAQAVGPADPADSGPEQGGPDLSAALALRAKGMAGKDADEVGRALAMLEAAGREASPAPRLLAEIGLTRKYLADMTGDTAHRAAAIDSDRKALAGFRAEGDARNAAVVAYNLVTALAGGSADDLARISADALLELAASAPSGLDKAADPDGWARLELDIGRLAFSKGSAEDDVRLVSASVAALEAGLAAAEGEEGMLEQRAEGENLLANGLQFLGARQGDRARSAEALAALRRSLALYEKAGLDQYRFYLEGRIAALEKSLTGAGPQSAASAAPQIRGPR